MTRRDLFGHGLRRRLDSIGGRDYGLFEVGAAATSPQSVRGYVSLERAFPYRHGTVAAFLDAGASLAAGAGIHYDASAGLRLSW